jgi:hypothetical protein
VKRLRAVLLELSEGVGLRLREDDAHLTEAYLRNQAFETLATRGTHRSAPSQVEIDDVHLLPAKLPSAVRHESPTRSVDVQPGLTVLTRIPFGPSSSARDFISPMTAMRREFDRMRFSMGCFTE